MKQFVNKDISGDRMKLVCIKNVDSVPYLSLDKVYEGMMELKGYESLFFICYCDDGVWRRVALNSFKPLENTRD